MSLWKVDSCETNSDTRSLNGPEPNCDHVRMISELTARLEQMEAKMDQVEVSRKVSDAKVKVLESKLRSSEAKIEEVNAKLKESEAQFELFETFMMNDPDGRVKQLECDYKMLKIELFAYKQEAKETGTTNLVRKNKEALEDLQKELSDINKTLAKVESSMNKKVEKLIGDGSRMRKQMMLSGLEMEEVRKMIWGDSQLAPEQQNKADNDLWDAAEQGDIKQIRKALDNGANINSANKGFIRKCSPLMIASRNDHPHAVEYMLLRGSDVNAYDSREDTSLHNACIKGCDEVVSILLDYGAKISQENSKAWTPLHCASSKGKLSTVRLLLERGADATLSNCNDQTPFAGFFNWDRKDAVKKVFKEFMDK